MIGQGATQTSSPPGHPPTSASIKPISDVNITALACAPFDSLLSPTLPAASNSADQRRPSTKAPHPSEVLKCPRCESLDTKFCYYNNYSLTQPRYFCKNCKRYWTAGGALRNVPVGGGLRKNKRSKMKLAAVAAADAQAAALTAQALAGSTGKPQHQPQGSGEALQKVDNRTTSVTSNAAMPSQLVVGVPELNVYNHSSGMSSSNSHIGTCDLGSAGPHYVEHVVDENRNTHATVPTLHQQGRNFFAKEEANVGATFYSCESAQVPQFYSSYATSLPVQFSSAGPHAGAAMPGYAVNYNFFSADPNGNAPSQDCGNACLGVSAPAHPTEEVKLEKDVEGPANSYDWQLISDGLFNGSGAADGSFLYAPSSSWPDFSQFNDPGPG